MVLLHVLPKFLFRGLFIEKLGLGQVPRDLRSYAHNRRYRMHSPRLFSKLSVRLHVVECTSFSLNNFRGWLVIYKNSEN